MRITSSSHSQYEKFHVMASFDRSPSRDVYRVMFSGIILATSGFFLNRCSYFISSCDGLARPSSAYLVLRAILAGVSENSIGTIRFLRNTIVIREAEHR